MRFLSHRLKPSQKRSLLTSCLPPGRSSAIVRKSVAEGNFNGISKAKGHQPLMKIGKTPLTISLPQDQKLLLAASLTAIVFFTNDGIGKGRHWHEGITPCHPHPPNPKESDSHHHDPVPAYPLDQSASPIGRRDRGRLPGHRSPSNRRGD